MKGKYPLVQIDLDDAYHFTDSWVSWKQIAEAYKEERFKISNVGWVIYEDKKYVILAGKRDMKFWDFGFVMMIPKSLIRKRKLI